MKSVLNFLIIFLFFINASVAEEGMYPLSEIDKLDLDQLGFEIAGWELYNPDGISLIDGICKVGGCSGSFVSSQGLILTNHHCAYEAIRDASTPQNDFLEHGFHAATREQEVRAEGYQVRITVDYYDVSESITSVITAGMDPADRTEAIKNQIKSIELQAEEDHPGLRAEVAEMFIGRTYVIFLYRYLKDVRLVYAPPRSIGNFGGEIDNWMWPRHSGDFSLMRVYVAPDGSSADYSEDNIPYEPEKVIEIEPNGVDEDDFVFILGYPGRTYRHRTSHHLAFEYDLRLPTTADLYQWQISILKGFGINDRDISLKLASRIKSLSNRMKNYRGKLQGIRRIGLVEQRLRLEQELQEHINSNPDRKERYGNIL
ncbi:MAG: S46 family peptidase, partial [Candidatus Marinimicrobia bacterium]|nr:S46 family peptidase [Candidatus Neomarinimicrobiota bacterium]